MGVGNGLVATGVVTGGEQEAIGGGWLDVYHVGDVGCMIEFDGVGGVLSWDVLIVEGADGFLAC